MKEKTSENINEKPIAASRNNSLETYYAISKEYDKLWVTFAKSCGLSPAECGVLFSLREGLNTQSEICEELSMAKQTANSAIKKLTDKGLILLEASKDDMRAKRITFTQAGEAFAVRNIDAINAVEEGIWAKMTAEEKESLIRISQKYNRLFKQALEEFLNNGH
ncbi:MAG: MarR family transcriptional regulator [Bacillota bacterium]|nr:MarR family transcriptional regulator [Bacillota bacterium]